MSTIKMTRKSWIPAEDRGKTLDYDTALVLGDSDNVCEICGQPTGPDDIATEIGGGGMAFYHRACLSQGERDALDRAEDPHYTDDEIPFSLGSSNEVDYPDVDPGRERF